MLDKGAHFFRCDLQVHTPRDAQWSGAARVSTADREAYADSLVQACRDKGIHGIAITDHHDMLFAPFIRRAALAETDGDGKRLPEGERLVVFPGMELTLGVPCQALILFDADFPDEWFSQVMTAMVVTPSAATESKTAQTERLAHIESLRKLKEDLDKHAWLRDRYIIFPNVTNEGKSSILRDGFPGKYVEMPCVGGYIDGEMAKLKPGNLNKISGKEKAWGNKRIACIQTSDSRRDDHAHLGDNSTWIKWATPTAEALRQACLAQESRVSHKEPTLPSVAVGSVSVNLSLFLGAVDLELNPQYTALIGGRGTGKSTILEYLRWALCDQPPDSADEDTPNYQARRGRLIDQTLKPVKGAVQVRFDVNGVPHVVRRSSVDGSVVMKIGAGELRPCTEEEVRTLLPIQAYSQKQLSDVSVRLDELGRFITAPIRADLSRVDREATDRAARVRQTHATRVRQRALAKTIKNRELEESSLAEQAAAIGASLSGLSSDDKKALDDGKLFEIADRSMNSWSDGISTIADAVKELAGTVRSHGEQLAPSPTEPDAEILSAAHEEYRAFLNEAQSALDVLTTRARGLTLPVAERPEESPWKRWAARISVVRAAYQDAMQRSSAHSEKMKQLRDIEERITKHARETSKVNDELRALASAEAAYEAERTAWVALQEERNTLVQQQCAQLTITSAGAIRAELKKYADATAFANTLRQSLSGSRVTGGKIDALGEAITGAADSRSQWAAVLADLEKLAEFEAEESSEQRPQTPVLQAAGMSAADQERIAKTLKPSDWLALSLTPIESVPTFEYRAREGDYIPFKNASAGQQATALLKTLLNQSGPPLIIDQPEEDLDNPVMLEIVEQVWLAKQKRQLIFASHNANLVVNGDAELVAWCEYRTAGDQSRGLIAGEGAIDIPDVREAIKKIMEGGEAAFNLRKDKYGF